MDNRIIGLAVTLMIGIILAGSVLVPVINNAQDHTETMTNVAASSLYEIDDTEPTTFKIENSEYSINGVPNIGFNANYSTIAADSFILRKSGSIWTECHISNDVAAHSTVESLDLTANNHKLTGTINGNAVDIDYQYLYYQGPGNQIMTTGGVSWYVAGDDAIYCTGYNSHIGASGAARFFKMTGSINDGFTCEDFNGESIEFSKVNYEKVHGYEDLYLISSIEFNSSIEEYTLILDRCIVPATVDATKIHNSNADSIIAAIPIIIIASLLIFAVRAVAHNRD